MNDYGNAAAGNPAGPPALPADYGMPMVPIPAAERIISLDVLRGFALLGILISNMLYFSQPVELNGLRNGAWLTPVDWVVDWISVFLVEGKFYPLFALLFGLGFSIQLDRASSRGQNLSATYSRRLAILMGFGLLHGIFIWEGDILLAYAISGFALLLFRNCKTLTISVWAVALILLPALAILAGGVGILLLSQNPDIARSMREEMADNPHEKLERIKAFVTGNYLDAISYRLSELLLHVLATMVFAPVFLGLFLLGLLAGRKRFLTDVAKNKRFLVRVMIVGGLLGLVGNFLGAWMIMAGSAQMDFGSFFVGTGIISIFGIGLTAAYVAGLVLLIHRRPKLASLPPLAAVGQMALTNYLLQSLIATTIFYGYGLGLGGEIGRLATIGIGLLIFAAQVLLCMVWLKYFRSGPMEWLWRSITYNTRQPMRRV